MHHSALIGKERRLSVGEKEDYQKNSEFDEKNKTESILKEKIKLNKI